jgi:hypothetical protein
MSISARFSIIFRSIWAWIRGEEVVFVKYGRKIYCRILRKKWDPFIEELPPVVKIDGDYYFVFPDNTIRDTANYHRPVGKFSYKNVDTQNFHIEGRWMYAKKSKRIFDQLSKD